jgi:hypothetical protein
MPTSRGPVPRTTRMKVLVVDDTLATRRTRKD